MSTDRWDKKKVNSEPASPPRSIKTVRKHFYAYVRWTPLSPLRSDLPTFIAPAVTRNRPDCDRTGVPNCDQGIPGVGPEDSDGSEDSGVSFSLAS